MVIQKFIGGDAMNKTFSIVITTYNRLPFLKLAIRSALNQTLPCEIIVIDDLSNDGTREYVLGLGNRVIYHRNSVNLGRAASVNLGVELARGKWIKILDDDDRLLPNCIEEMSKAIAGFPEAVIASCQAIRVDCNYVELGSTPPVGTSEIDYILQEDIHYQMLIGNLPFGVTAQVSFRKDAFLKAGGWNRDLPTGGCKNIDSWVRIAQHGNAIFVNQALSYWTRWPGSAAGKLSLKERLDANILLKERIYPLVHPKYRSQLPERRELENFLKLHWALVGLRNGSIAQSWQIVSQSLIFSANAWKQLALEIWHRKVVPLSNKVIHLHNNPTARLKHSEKLALEYYNLATAPELSEEQSDRMVEILEETEGDRALSLLINEVDFIVAKEFNLLPEGDPLYYEEQRKKILAGILDKIADLRSQRSSNEYNPQANGFPIPAPLLVFDYFREP